jgi:hypothetical protein
VHSRQHLPCSARAIHVVACRTGVNSPRCNTVQRHRWPCPRQLKATRRSSSDTNLGSRTQQHPVMPTPVISCLPCGEGGSGEWLEHVAPLTTAYRLSEQREIAPCVKCYRASEVRQRACTQQGRHAAARRSGRYQPCRAQTGTVAYR